MERITPEEALKRCKKEEEEEEKIKRKIGKGVFENLCWIFSWSWKNLQYVK